MPASPLDSALYRQLFGDDEIARLFSDSAEIRAMLLVEGALAQAQGAAGLIPAESAAFIHRAALEVQIDPAALAVETGANAVPVPALVAAFRAAVEAPEHAQFIHWGATSQDIIDTALILRLRQVLAIYDARLDRLIAALGVLAETHAELPLAARTYGQYATPTSFGALVADWGWPLVRHRDRLAELRPRLLQVSLSGAAGTLAAMGESGPEIRARLAQALSLPDPGTSWHAQRDGLAEFAGLCTAIAGSLGKIGEDLVMLSQSGIEEVRLAGAGASSTMPQKTNPVAPSLLVTLARHMVGLNANMQGAILHRQSRDATAWLVEWLTLPQISIALGRALSTAQRLAETVTPDPARMRAPLEEGAGLIHAEALSFALARKIPRPDAQARVKALAAEARETGRPLAELAARDFPGTDWAGLFTPENQLGQAPAQARNFAARANALSPPAAPG